MPPSSGWKAYSRPVKEPPKQAAPTPTPPKPLEMPKEKHFDPMEGAEEEPDDTPKPKKEPPRAAPAKGGPAKVSKAPPVPIQPPEPKPPSEEELFRQEMWGVRPIVDPRSARAGRRAPDPVDVPPRPRVSEEAEVLAQLADLCDGSGPWDIADSDEFIEGLAPGIDRRILQRLRRGEFAIQGHVDLHGQTSEQARETIERFVQESRVNGQRCVLIIHGRGLNSKDQIPVLKERVRVWLTRGRIARSVLAYATARPADGGAGAVYVLLRK